MRVVFVIVWFFMRDRPADLGLRPYGQAANAPAAPLVKPMAPLAALAFVAEALPGEAQLAVMRVT